MLFTLLAESAANSANHINIEKFAHFFEVFATLNLAYGGTELFESILDTGVERFFEEPIDQANNWWTSTYDRLRNFKESNPASFFEDVVPKDDKTPSIWKSKEIGNLTGHTDLDWQAANAVRSYENINRYMAEYSDKINTIEKEYRTKVSDIRHNYKTIFFTSGLFCLLVLLIQGYDQFIPSQEDCLCHMCLICMLLTSLLLLYMFLRISYPDALVRLDDFVETRLGIMLRKDGQFSRVKAFGVVILLAITGIFFSQSMFMLEVISWIPKWISVTGAVLIGLMPCLFYLDSMHLYDSQFRTKLERTQFYLEDTLRIENYYITNHVDNLSSYS